jgi:hypothetical protein
MQKFSTQHYSLFLRTLLVATLFALVAGCSLGRMAYSNGETLSWLWLDRYLGFQEDQKTWVQREIDRFFAWHRREQLPAYIEILEKAQQRVKKPLSEAEVKADFELLRRKGLLMVEHSLPTLAELALSLRPEQIAHLEKKFADNNKDYRREHLRDDIEQRQHTRYKRALKQAEYFFGSLSSQQEQRLKSLSNARPLNNELILKFHQRRQQEMLSMLKKIQAERPPKDAVIKMLRDYVAATLDYYGEPEFQAFYRDYQAASIHQVTELVNQTTPEQKQHLVNNLQKWIDDFQRLHLAQP